MGCCYSSEKPTVYEVTLDNDGVARHVSEGQGTHYIHVSESNETILEEKPTSTLEKPVLTSPNPTFQRPLVAHPHSKQRIHPVNIIKDNEKKQISEPPSLQIGNTMNKV
ncbi:hypothetical protein BCR42DRAFT_44430 [Absidia repens]|uniref:Uncharacterized protein n=1 Tax=Absidia repens TaxID=90262 RepID=A0A1X2IGF4_9FUNG|nr:hypothetical protein BCR42DRAFT_44430 [Absidia repens]